MTVDGGGVTMLDSRSFRANPVLSSGSESVAVSATAGGGSGTTTNNYKFEVIGAASQTLTYDNNGNMLSDGTNTYLWDAEDRLIQITYPGMNNKTEMSYSPTGGRVKIVETVSGSVTSTKQFIGGEERDGSGNVTKQFFVRGQRNGSTSYFYCRDHLGSIRTMTDNSGTSVSDRSFDPYGRASVLSESTAPDFGFAGMYVHARSGLNLTMFRAYSPTLGHWLSRDPLGDGMSYAGNSPINLTDILGLAPYQFDFLTAQEAVLAGFAQQGLLSKSQAAHAEYAFFALSCGNRFAYSEPFQGSGKGTGTELFVSADDWNTHAAKIPASWSQVATAHTHPNHPPPGYDPAKQQGYYTFSPNDAVMIDASITGYIANAAGQVRRLDPGSRYDTIVSGPLFPLPNLVRRH